MYEFKQPDFSGLAKFFGDEPDEVQERRAHPRRELKVPVHFVPIDSVGYLNEEARIDGQTFDISSGGIGIEIQKQPLEPRWAIRLNMAGKPATLEVSVRHVQRINNGFYRLGCQFVRRIGE